MHARAKPSHRWIVWMTALVFLMAALAPTVSRWMSATSPIPLALQEVCVSRGVGPSVIVHKPHPAGAPATLDHCPLCVLQGDQLGLPPAQLATLAVNTLTDEAPALFLHAPRTLSIWAAAQARAPPAAQTTRA